MDFSSQSLNEKVDIKSLNQRELTEFIESLGEKAFRAKQIYQWIHEKQVDSFAEMTNISKKFIETLEANAYLTSLKKRRGSDFEIGWNQKVSLFARRWKCYRKCVDAL